MAEAREDGAVLPRWATHYLWPALLAVIVVVRLSISDWQRYRVIINDEWGLVENLSVLFALAASGLCLAAFRLRARLPRRWLGVWLLLCAIGCFFYAGEEASWGQHWTGYGSPEFFAERNSQGELNLHNLGKLSTQRVPKMLLSVGVVVTGFMLPLRRRRIGRVWPPAHPLHWWLPDMACVPVAGLVLLTRILERIKTWGDLDHVILWDIELKETNEMLITGFFVIYAWSLWRRLRARDAT
jgi:hypothetical protein